MVKKPKLLSSIRAKLFSAVAMLLVAVIMVVSSTYAWFTLSTAPEVTGISTAIGANGSLEMALMPLTGDVRTIASQVGQSLSLTGAQKDAVNRTWGNLVDMDDATYGINQIVLMPSTLNTTVVDGQNILPSSALSTPMYGPDGRVESIANNTIFGLYDSESKSFQPIGSDATDRYGFRGVGVASGMTERQLAYRNAMSTASTAASSSKAAAASSLSAEGATLANIVIKKATGSGDYTLAEVNALINMATKLATAIDHIEKAYAQYLLVYAASEAVENEAVWQALKGAIDGGSFEFIVTEESVTASFGGESVTLPTELANAVRSLYSSKQDVSSAKVAFESLASGKDDETTFTWEDIREPLLMLADPDKMTVNDLTPAEIKADLGKLASAIGSGVTVQMASGAGVYADIADHCGNYSASIIIPKIEYNGIVVEDMPARMETRSSMPIPYLNGVQVVVSAKSAPAGESGSMPLTEFYGYVLDLVFRTNAAESNLLLQTDAADRIYDDNANDDTMGHGSTMTFASSSPSFTDDQVKGLMSHLRIVFFTPDMTGANTGTVLAEARLDVNNAKKGVDGWTASMYLLNAENGFITNQADAKITAMNQNEATAVSVLVYLDGETMTNQDVATTASSMTGKMNLQFASSATLVPMEYANLHEQGNNSNDTTAESTTTQTPAESTEAEPQG